MLFLFSLVIEEGGVKMKLTVIDTPGFGDQINNENWYVSAPEVSSLNSLRERRGADPFPLRTTCVLPWHEVGPPGRLLSLLTIHEKPTIGRTMGHWPSGRGRKTGHEMEVRGSCPFDVLVHLFFPLTPQLGAH